MFRRLFYPLVFILLAQAGKAQVESNFINREYIQRLNKEEAYLEKKDSILHVFATVLPGAWGSFVKGVKTNLATSERVVALTFDACDGGFDAEMIKYLQDEHIHATLFVTGKWIDSHYDVFKELSQLDLFEIENHGFNHRPASVNGRSAYKIKGTSTVAGAFDEIEANERKIEAITGRRPLFYRSATAFIDEASVQLALRLGVKVVHFSVLSGDAVPHVPAGAIVQNILSKTKPGAIIIMHFNHPAWNGCQALKMVVPALRARGYSFVLLKDYPLTGK